MIGKKKLAPLSFAPLPLEDALRAAMAAKPPPHQSRRKAKRKAKKKSKAKKPR